MKISVNQYLPAKLWKKNRILLSILILIFLLIYTKGITKSNLWFSDASRHAMNGVFLFDLIKNLSIGDLWQYAYDYYTRYPALSLGYHLPFFPLIEAIFFAIGGISFVSARITVLFFGMIALIYWYRLIVLLYDKKVAFFSTIFLFTTPLIIKWASAPMLELPALTMIILTAYTFFNYLKNEHCKYLYAFLICSGLSIMTKQTTGFISPLLFIYLFVTKNFNKFLKKEAITPIIIFTILILSAIIMTLKLGKANIQQVTMISNDLTGTVFPVMSLTNLMYYPSQIMDKLSLPLVFLSSFYFIYVLIKKRTGPDVFFILWIFCAYLMMTYIGVKEPRYTYCMIPPFCLLAALALFKAKIKKINIGLVTGIILSIFQIVYAYQVKTPFISGYEQAAKFVADNPKGFAALVNLHYNGNFIFYFRKHDTNRQNIVIRSEKLFYYYDEKTDFMEILKSYAVKYVITENVSSKDFPQFEYVKKHLNSKNFVKLKEIKIDSNMRRFQGGSIIIYELKGEVEMKKETLTLQGWRFGRKVSVPLERFKDVPCK